MRQIWKGRRGCGECTDLRRFIFGVILAFGFFVVTACEFQRLESPDSSEPDTLAGDPATVIKEMLQASAASWNEGDLDGFMDDYWVSEDLTFSGATGVTRGWDNVKERYLQTYWAPGSVRDSLVFEDVEVHVLGAAHAIALGRYVLFPPGAESGTTPSSGFFTLVLSQMDGDWKIVHDHTSSTPEESGQGT
jgi:beta-aspartyl-peptidase (threonine type)